MVEAHPIAKMLAEKGIESADLSMPVQMVTLMLKASKMLWHTKTLDVLSV
ncbi:MAG: hypothetical protein KKD17_00660 [Nanoarchaeota archaeon]|nr:hypothetical protein [Nanoarchaeota archaeon]